MKMYEKSLLVDMLETKILEKYNEYYPQGQYNGIFVNYLYKFIRDNTYCGKHNELLYELNQLKQYSDTLTIKENTDFCTYIITDTKIISDIILEELTKILKIYYNYNFLVKSPNRIVIGINFGWLPPNAGSWLNLINDENLIDYYIDGITLVPNTHTVYNGKPDSGYVCYRIADLKEYDTIMFLINNSIKFENNTKFIVASLLTELEGSKGATLNRIVETEPTNFFYEIGHYNKSYISAEKASVIIQIPYEYAISECYYLFNVNNSVIINNKNNIDINDVSNYFVRFDSYYITMISNSLRFTGKQTNVQPKTIVIELSYKNDENDNYNIDITIKDDGKGNLKFGNYIVGNVNYDSAEFTLNFNDSNIKDKIIIYPLNISYQSDKYFIKNDVNANNVINLINHNIELFDDTLIQYLLGDFIWITSDSKLIAYVQNLINALFTSDIKSDGIWSNELSQYIKIFKEAYNVQSIFDDDVIDKFTEELMTTEYKRITNNSDPNKLFNEW